MFEFLACVTESLLSILQIMQPHYFKDVCEKSNVMLRARGYVAKTELIYRACAIAWQDSSRQAGSASVISTSLGVKTKQNKKKPLDASEDWVQ